MKAKQEMHFKTLHAALTLLVAASFVFAFQADAEAKGTPPEKRLSKEADAKRNWNRFDVKKIAYMNDMFIPEVEGLFLRRNSETFVPAIQYFGRPIKKDFETDFKHITRDVLSKINDEGKLPTYVKPVQDKTSVIVVKGQKVKARYLEYEYQGQKRTKVTCFTAIQTGNSIHTFFTQTKKGTFNECQKEMRDVVNYI